MNRHPKENRQRTAPGALGALLVFLASFGSVAPPRLPARTHRAPELTWSADQHAPVGDVERHRERPSIPIVRPRRGADAGPWRTPTVLAALFLLRPHAPTAGLLPQRTDAIPVPTDVHLRAPHCPRGPPTA